MRQTWDKTFENLTTLGQMLDDLLQILPQSASFKKRSTRIRRKWNQIQGNVTELDEYISSQVDALDVKLPFDTEKFFEAWQYWKEYLIEQHNIRMKSRYEIMALQELVQINDNDQQECIRCLKYAMAHGYRKFFKLDPKQSNQEPIKQESNDPDFN